MSAAVEGGSEGAMASPEDSKLGEAPADHQPENLRRTIMLNPSSLFCRAAWSVTLVTSVLVAGACGDDSSSSSSPDAGNVGPDAMNNPPNPSGLGPAPVDLGLPTDVASAGSYV